MREHAIPQDITGYRFHIIGNMTLKQFAEVGAGCFVGFLFYTTNLPAAIKWPFIILSAALGAMIAFVPIEERPLDHWVSTFFKVLYKPTKFFWRRTPKIPDPFNYTPLDAVVNEQREVDLRPARRQRIKEYLSSVEPPKAVDTFDATRNQQIDSIMTTFTQVNVPTASIQATEAPQRPDLKVRVRSLTPATAASITSQIPADLPEVSLPSSEAPPTEVPPPEIVPAQILSEENLDQPTAPPSTDLTTQQVAQSVSIPTTENVAIERTQTQTQTSTELPDITALPDAVYVPDQVVTPVATSQAATLNTELPFPLAPTEPNKVVGMVLTPNNEILNGAIVEIQTANGQVARAVRTNSLGQFFVTTPLEPGSYTVTVEKEGYQFSPMSLDLNNNIVPPIEVRSL